MMWLKQVNDFTVKWLSNEDEGCFLVPQFMSQNFHVALLNWINFTFVITLAPLTLKIIVPPFCEREHAYIRYMRCLLEHVRWTTIQKQQFCSSYIIGIKTTPTLEVKACTLVLTVSNPSFISFNNVANWGACLQSQQGYQKKIHKIHELEWVKHWVFYNINKCQVPAADIQIVR